MDKLAGVTDDLFQTRVHRLVSDLPSPDIALAKLIEDRHVKIESTKGDSVRGKVVFDTLCLVCHQIEGTGELIGPQLSGIGNRGAERLIEDVLDPSRHIDPGFLPEVLTLRDGQILTGLFRREDGDAFVYANVGGEEFTIRKNSLLTRKETKTSLMPAVYGQAIPEADFFHLMAYLMAQR